MSGDDARAVARSMAERCMRLYPSHDGRVGIRSGLHDGAHLCDAIAREIEAGGRASKARAAEAAVAKRSGDALWAMAALISVTPATPEECQS